MPTLADIYSQVNPQQALTIGADPALADLQARRALALQMIQSGSAKPTMSPFAAASQALGPLIGAMALKRSNQEYSDMAQGASPELSSIAHSADPVSVAAASQNPLIRALLPQLVNQQMQKKLQLNQLMAEKYGAYLNDDGSVSAIPGVAGAASNLEGAQAFARAMGAGQADIINKPKEAAATAAATLPYDIAKPVEVARRTAPIDVSKAVEIARQKAPIEVQQAIDEAIGKLGPEILGGIAKEGMIPRAVTPTEALKSPFGALPQDAQSAILQSINAAIQRSAATRQGAGSLPSAPGTQPAQPQPSASAPATPSTAALPLTIPPEKPDAPAIAAPAAAPAIQPNAGIPPNMSPQQFEAESGLGKDFAAKDKVSYDKANTGLGSLYQMNAAADKLATTGGWATPGSDLAMKAGAAKWVNSWEQTFGFKPTFDTSTIGSWENLAKESKRMGFDLATQLGSRESQQVIQQATSAVPHDENSYYGFRTVSSSIEQVLQRERELYQYKAQQLANGGSLASAEANFNKAHPPAEYTLRALSNAVPDKAVELLKDPTAYIQSQGGNIKPEMLRVLQDPKIRAEEFNRTYGPGMAQFILSGGRTGLGTAGGTPVGMPGTMPGTTEFTPPAPTVGMPGIMPGPVVSPNQ